MFTKYNSQTPGWENFGIFYAAIHILMLFYSRLAQKIRAGGLSLTPQQKIMSELGGLENELGGSTPHPPDNSITGHW